MQIAWEEDPSYPAWNWWKPEGNEFVCQWRSSLAALDVNHDGHLDLVAVDHEGFLACYFRDPERDGLTFTPGRRIFHSADEQKSAFDQTHNPVFADADNDGRNDFVYPLVNGNLPYIHTAHVAGRRLLSTKTHSSVPHENNTAASRYPPLRLSAGWAGRSGRRQFCFTDWDGDGKLDLLVNSINVNFLRNVAQQPGEFLFEDMGPVAKLKLAGHTTCPTMWQRDKDQECLLIGAEDGYFYLLEK